MSATILSAFYDIDMLYKQEKGMNMNAIHINSLLDKKAVGAPLTALTGTGTGGTTGASPGFFRRNSVSNMESMINGNKYPLGSYGSSGGISLKDNMASGNNCAAVTTALMNKENKFRDRAFSDESCGGERGADRGQQQQQLQALQQQQQQQQQKAGSQINSTRYKTELCRPFEENGACKYGEKCQFAHGYHELRSLSRHPKYKTEPCRTFHTIGFCPYGPRCHFIHNADERRPAPANNANNANAAAQQQQGEPGGKLCGYGQRGGDAAPHHHHHHHQAGYGQVRDRPKLHHSLSFSGFSSHRGLDGDSPLEEEEEEEEEEAHTSRTPPPLLPSSSASCSPGFYEDVLSPGSMSCVNSAFSFPGQDLKALLAPLAVHQQQQHQHHHHNAFANHQHQQNQHHQHHHHHSSSNGAFYGSMQQQQGGNGCPPSPPYNMSHLQSLRRLNDSPVFEPPASPPDSLSDRESYASGSLSSSGSLSGSESPSLDAGRRLPIFSRLSISDD